MKFTGSTSSMRERIFCRCECGHEWAMRDTFKGKSAIARDPARCSKCHSRKIRPVFLDYEQKELKLLGIPAIS